MRNLLALLMTCSPDELTRIASAWSVELPRASRSERAAVLGREMVRDASGRRFWERSSEGARELWFRMASAPEQQLSALRLGRNDPALQECLEAGLLWAFEEGERAGGLPSLRLPPVPDPTLVLPPELCRLANRLHAEVEQGDISELELDALLPRLGTGELENLAAYWGLAAEPGSITREELLESLTNRLSGASTERVLLEAPEPARRLYLALLELGGNAPTAEVGKQAGLEGPALRDAVSDLNDRLLAMELFESGWRLFTPRGPVHAAPGQHGAFRAPEPTVPPLRHVSVPEWSGAWDLLNLLRALQLYEVPADRSGALPEAFVSRFDTALATRPAEPGQALAFLMSSARALGLVEQREGAVKPSERVRQWVDAGLPEESRRLVACWVERGTEAETDQLAGAPGFRNDPDTLQAARRVLLKHLAGCEPGKWYPVEGLLDEMEAESPNLLRPQNRLVRDLGSAAARAALEDWKLVEGKWVRAALLGPLSWLHVVETGQDEPPAFTPTVDGAWLCGRVRSQPRNTTTPRLTVSEEGRVRPSSPDSRLIWTLGGFARPVRAGGRPCYLIDRRSVARARTAGLGPGAVVQFLRRHAESSVPVRLVELVHEWGRDPHRVSVRPALIVRCETEAGVEELLSSPIVRAYSPKRVSEDVVLLSLPLGDANEEREAILRRLTRSGLFSTESPER
ncbi:MAG: helicase-associated domain-containing protein [Chloroflexota bacterium]|nr:helicase-associated domain-containing protein [Chloroflexota bacterium]